MLANYFKVSASISSGTIDSEEAVAALKVFVNFSFKFREVAVATQLS